MIRTYIIPQSNNIQITIPDNYIGKQLEVIIFSEEEIDNIDLDSNTNTEQSDASKNSNEL